MLILWRLLHIFGFIFWFVGLMGTTSAQAAAKRAPDAEARRGAWSVVKRLQPWEIVGLVLTPISGIFLTVTVYGHLFRGSPSFVHIKLLLAIVAAVLNIVVIVLRKKADARLATGDAPGFAQALKPVNIMQGIATLMLPLAVLAVVIIKYGG